VALNDRVCFLPATQTPRFPDRCANCGSPSPQDAVRLGGGRLEYEVPICNNCASQTRRRNAMQKYLLWGGGITAVLVVILLMLLTEGVGRFLALLIGFVFLIPYLISAWLLPVPLALITVEDKIQYEFRDADYASDFAALNEARIGFPNKG
jgi:hypothetical protein